MLRQVPISALNIHRLLIVSLHFQTLRFTACAALRLRDRQVRGQLGHHIHSNNQRIWKPPTREQP